VIITEPTHVVYKLRGEEPEIYLIEYEEPEVTVETAVVGPLYIALSSLRSQAPSDIAS
jgi:hypothetical protein